MLNARTWLFAGAALLLMIVAIVFTESEPVVPASPTTESNAQHEAPLPKLSAPAPEVDGASVQSHPRLEASVGLDDEEGNDAAFRTNAAGELVVDEQTRLNIETLIAQTEPRELYAAVREHTESLPPAAARRAEELVDKFVYYQQAQRQTYPPDDAPLTAADAIRQFEGLRALRETYFGPELARQFFGKEEAVGREMIEVMRVENDLSLTAQEKLERLQSLREQLPGIAAIERNNRQSAETTHPE